MATQSWYRYGSNQPPDNAQSSNDASEPVDDRPLGELFADMSKSVQTLLRKEVELAKVEVKEQATRAGKAAAMFAGTAVVGFIGLILLSFAAAWGVAEAIPVWLAFLAVGLLYAVIAGLLLTIGKKKLETVQPPKQTMQTLKEDVDVAKSSLTRGVNH